MSVDEPDADLGGKREEPKDVDAVMQAAIGAAWADLYPGDMLLKFVVLLEVLDAEDSDRGVVTSSSPGMKRWEAGGLLSHGVMNLQADYTAALLRDDDA